MSCYDKLKSILKELKEIAEDAKAHEEGSFEDFRYAEDCKDAIVNKLLELEL